MSTENLLERKFMSMNLVLTLRQRLMKFNQFERILHINVHVKMSVLWVILSNVNNTDF